MIARLHNATRLKLRSTLLSIGFFCLVFSLTAQEHSVARKWNEQLLDAIRQDFARPTIHARNLYHMSVVMYDSWAVYDSLAKPFFLGDTLGGFYCPFDGILPNTDIAAAREETMSYACYRLMRHRFQNSPGVIQTYLALDDLMEELGYFTNVNSTDYSDGDPAKLGNYLAAEMIAFGLQDGSNESLGYANQYYTSVNPPLVVAEPGNPDMEDPNRWQRVQLEGFVDQGGNPFPTTPPFLTPEWGNVVPFALSEDAMNTYQRDGFNWNVYHDPGDPPYLDTTIFVGLEDPWKWSFVLVPIWQSHHDPSDGVMWDISPGTIGNQSFYPQSPAEYPLFYDLFNGLDASQGYPANPKTGLPYEPQIVPRGDYTRILAEFWADGPRSETPPGHWFSILNYVVDHPEFEARWRGQGEILDPLEWDVKAYFTLGGAVHDAAIWCWAVKGYYDFVRPVSAIRYMAEKGQCSDPELPNYHPAGFPLIPGYIEQIAPGDPLAGENDEFIGDIKLYTWLGPFAIGDIETENAGSGWLRAKEWWPYQRPTFVSPPFAGYVSGHSTYSRTAAEVMTAITGDPFFPGGLGEFEAPVNEYLVFENGPSVNCTLQWATYLDASDQCSLSRIWGGIHPPIDDIPGRMAGSILGPDAVQHAESFMDPGLPNVIELLVSDETLTDADAGSILQIEIVFNEAMDPTADPQIAYINDEPENGTLAFAGGMWSNPSTFVCNYIVQDANVTLDNINIRVDGGVDLEGNPMKTIVRENIFIVDTQNPSVLSLANNLLSISDADAGMNQLVVDLVFDETMDTSAPATLIFPADNPLGNTLTLNTGNSGWNNSFSYTFRYDIADGNVEWDEVDLSSVMTTDANGNEQQAFVSIRALTIDTRNPLVTSILASENIVSDDETGAEGFAVEIIFDEIMNTQLAPELGFTGGDPLANTLILNGSESGWLDETRYLAVFDVADANEEIPGIGVDVINAQDTIGNWQTAGNGANLFNIDTKNPTLVLLSANTYEITDNEEGDAGFYLMSIFDDNMNQNAIPQVVFPVEDPSNTLSFNAAASYWLNATTYMAYFDVTDNNENIAGVDVELTALIDDAGNEQEVMYAADFFSIAMNPVNMEELEVIGITSVFPNPVNAGNYLTIVLDEPETTLNLEIYAMNGALVESIRLKADARGMLQLSTNTLNSGLYTFQLNNTERSASFRVQVIK
jgi:hypothetical protein